jgi:hypothetical protein
MLLIITNAAHIVGSAHQWMTIAMAFQQEVRNRSVNVHLTPGGFCA